MKLLSKMSTFKFPACRLYSRVSLSFRTQNYSASKCGEGGTAIKKIKCPKF